MSSFFSTYSSVANNKDSFKAYKQKKLDEKSKREDYFKEHPVDQKTLEESNALKRVVLNTVNTMDQYSEDKAQSVEQSFAIGSSLIALPIYYISDYALRKYFKFKNNKVLKELEIFANKNDITIDEITKNAIKSGATEKLEKFAKENQKIQSILKKVPKKQLFKVFLYPTVLTSVIFSISQLIGTSCEIKASKIARFQSREILDDPKNYVQYTKEQLEQANKIVKENSNTNSTDLNKKSFFESTKDVISLIKDSKRAQEKSKDLDSFHLKQIDVKDRQKAYQQQTVLNNAIEYINNRAEEFSENMELTTQMLIGGSILGYFISNTAVKSFLKLMDKIFGNTKQKWLKTVLLNKNFVSHFISIAISCMGMIYAKSLQKEASRAGRWKAKQELLNDPSSFVYVDAKELEKIETKETNQTKGILRYFRIMQDCIISMNNYRKTKDEEAIKQKEFNEALKQIEISKEQLEEAKNLQKRINKTFDVIDDNSQRYSEHVEAAFEIINESLSTLYNILIFMSFPFLIKNGTTIITKASGKLLDWFPKFKKKYVNKIFDEIPMRLKTIANEKSLEKTIENASCRTKFLSKDEFAKKFKSAIESIKNAEDFESFKNALDFLNPRFVLMNVDEKNWRVFQKTFKKIASEVDDEKIEKLYQAINSALKDYQNIEIKDLEDMFPKVLMTKDVKNALYACTISGFWSIIFLNFIVFNWMTEVQVNAGKLGVMNAIDELNKQNHQALLQK